MYAIILIINHWFNKSQIKFKIHFFNMNKFFKFCEQLFKLSINFIIHFKINRISYIVLKINANKFKNMFNVSKFCL